MNVSSDILEKFGLRIRDFRKGKEISQETLAERAGLHRTYIGMIERGEKNITLMNIQRIAQATGNCRCPPTISKRTYYACLRGG